MGAQQACCAAKTTDKQDALAAEDAPVSFNQDQIEEPLSPGEIALVQKTWGQAAGLGVETVGLILFKHIFTIAPEAIGLFGFKSEPNILNFTSPKLKAHGVKVVTTVGVAVDGLNELGAVVPVLQQLALQHVGYGVLPAHFPVVGKALMNTLQDGLKSDFTPAARLAWSKVWHVVSSTMISAGWPAAKEEGPFSKEEMDLVRSSWKKAAALGVETVGVLLFKHIFEIAPEALQLFPFKDETNYLESAALKGHAVKVVSTVGVAVDMLDKVTTLIPILTDLGKKHVAYGVLPPHYDVVGKAVMMTLKAGLGEELTADHEAAWGKVYGVVAQTMIGDNYPEGPFTREEMDLVRSSWKKAAALGVETVGVLLFKHIFEIAPEALQLFPFKNEKKYLESAALKGHAVKVVSTVGVAVDMIDKVTTLIPILADLGKKHVAYGVLPPHYDVVGKAVIMTLKAGLDKEFTADHEAAWGKVYGVVAQTMIGDNYK